MLPHVSDNNGIIFRDTAHGLDDSLRHDLGAVFFVGEGMLLVQTCRIRPPFSAVRLIIYAGSGDLLPQERHRPAQISHDGIIHRDVLIDLGGIDLKLRDLRTGGKLLYHAGHPIVEA